MRSIVAIAGLLLCWKAALGVVPSPVVSLPSGATIPNVGDSLSLDLSVDVADGIMAADFQIQYDSTIVGATGVSTTALTSACATASNTATDGRVDVSMACADPLSGSGALLGITFQARASGSSALNITVCTLNEGGIPCATSAGSVNVPTAIDVGKAVGRPGGVACLPTVLASGVAQVASTTNDIGYDSNLFSVTQCTVNPAIGPGTTADKQLTSSPVSSGVERVQVYGNPNVIPNGSLYGDTIAIGAGVGVGTYPVSNAPAAADPSGTPLAVTGKSGQIVVTTCTGDCDGSGVVSIGEVIKCVNLFLGQPFCNAGNPNLSCPVADANLNGGVSIGEVTQCVNRFLNGC